MSLSPAQLEAIVRRVNRRMNRKPAKPAFHRWLDTFVEEKGIDTLQEIRRSIFP